MANPMPCPGIRHSYPLPSLPILNPAVVPTLPSPPNLRGAAVTLLPDDPLLPAIIAAQAEDAATSAIILHI